MLSSQSFSSPMVEYSVAKLRKSERNTKEKLVILHTTSRQFSKKGREAPEAKGYVVVTPVFRPYFIGGITVNAG